MFAVGWEKTAENGRRGIAFVEQLVEMVGDVVGWREVRAAFREMAGDFEGALADSEFELGRKYPQGGTKKDICYTARVDHLSRLRTLASRRTDERS
jgi:hypothetical protein